MVGTVNGQDRAGAPERAGSTGIQSIEIGAPLLRALADAKSAQPLTTLATAVGMAPSKAHKYLTSFIRSGLVTQSELGRRYDLGPFALELGLAAMRRLDIMELAQPALDDLRDLLGTTVSMAVWANHGPTIVRWAETPHIMSVTIKIGTVMPLLTSSFGRTFAAFLDRRVTQEIMQAELADPEALARRAGLRNLADVERMLAEFRARRMSVAENLVDPGRAALCAPVFDLSNRIVAAIAVIGVEGRLDTGWDGTPARELARTARRLSARLGAQPDLIEPPDPKTGPT
jgi:DNA-binding IclR family transcriptional regulator